MPPATDNTIEQLKNLVRDPRIKALRDDPKKFRETILIDTNHGPARLAERLDAWQREDFEALDPAWKYVADPKAVVPQYRRAWLERPRGHSKTNDLAVMVGWVLFASDRRLVGVAAAADKDQARLLRDAIEKLVRLNEWLGMLLDVQNYRVVNRLTGGTLDIQSCDVASSYGITPDFVICDEVSHWPKRDLWESLISSAAKRERCFVTVITNAGYRDSWVWPVRESVLGAEGWYLHSLDGPQASWISEKQLAEQRRLLPSVAFDRLWMNRWADGGGDALEPGDIQQAVKANGGPLTAPEPGWVYLSGLDLGVMRDATAMVTIGIHVGYVEDLPQKEQDGANGQQEGREGNKGDGNSPRSRRRRFESHAERIAREDGFFDGYDGEGDEESAASSTAPLDYVVHEGTGQIKLVDVAVWRPEQEAGGRVSLDAVKDYVLQLHQRLNLATVGVDPNQAYLLTQQLRAAGVPIEGIPPTPQFMNQSAATTLDVFRERKIELFNHPALIADLSALRIEEKSYGYRLTSPRKTSTADDGGTASQGTRHGDTASALQIALWLSRDGRFKVATGWERKWQERELLCWP